MTLVLIAEGEKTTAKTILFPAFAFTYTLTQQIPNGRIDRTFHIRLGLEGLVCPLWTLELEKHFSQMINSTSTKR